MNKKLFICSMFALNSKSGMSHHSARIFTAVSAFEAEGLALDDVRSRKPIGEGWMSHDVSVGECNLDELMAETKVDL